MANGAILVTGAAGQLGGVGRTVTGLLLDRGLPVRAMVRREDDRAAALRAAGGGGGGRPPRTGRRLSGRPRLSAGLFRHVRGRRIPGGDGDHGSGRQGSRGERPGQHVPDDRLPDEHPEDHPEPSAAAALAQRAGARVVGPAGRHHPTDGLPGGLLPPLTGPSIRDRGRIELPFGRGKTNPVSTADVARVVAAVLADPGPHLGQIYELTGARSQDMHGVAREYSEALNREVTYSDVPPEDWERELKKVGLPDHLTRHLVNDGRVAPGGSV
jgi:NAD(P)H dehydrogenase (quinone)